MVDYVLEDQNIRHFPFRREYDEFTLPPGGDGYLAGEFPDGITTVDGVPVPATVRVLYRPGAGQPGDGRVVAQVQSKENGTWMVTGLNPALTYDVVGRKVGHNDVIKAGVRPVPFDQTMSLVGSFTLASDGLTLNGGISIIGGYGQKTISGITGSAPPGITFEIAGDVIVAVGDYALGGSYEWTLSVVDELQSAATITLSITLPIVDLYENSVVVLLSMDGNLEDKMRRNFQKIGNVSWVAGRFGQAMSVAGNGSASGTPAGACAVRPLPGLNFGTQDFTVEFFLKMAAGAPAAAILSHFDLGAGSSPGWQVYMNGSGRLQWYQYSGSANYAITGTTDIRDGQFHHVAFSRVNGQLRLFVDGIQQGSTATVSTAYGNNLLLLSVGFQTQGGGRYPMAGQLDELRITKGVARYIDPFSPPASAFPAPRRPAPPAPFEKAVTLASPLVWHRLSETSGKVLLDAVTGRNNATLNGTENTDYTLSQPSLVGEEDDLSIAFKGSGYASGTALSLAVANVSLMAVVKVDLGAPAATVVTPGSLSNNDSGGSRDRGLYLNGEGKLVATIWSGAIRTIVSEQALNDGVPHLLHLVCGANDTQGTRLYIDGKLVGAIPYISVDSSGTRLLHIARSNYVNWPGGSAATLQGELSEVAWFNKALSPEEVAGMAQAAGLYRP